MNKSKAFGFCPLQYKVLMGSELIKKPDSIGGKEMTSALASQQRKTREIAKTYFANVRIKNISIPFN